MSNRAAICAALFAVAIAQGARAQVGHDPARSPFRDITTQQGLGGFVAAFRGNRARPGVGWREGMGLGIRFHTRLSPALDFTGTLSRISTSRAVLNVTDSTQPRDGGTLDAALLGLDVALTLNLTGPKTWRRLAPYLSLGAGILAPTSTVQDRSGYKAGSNFALVPALGVRWFASRRLVVGAEARDFYFRYEWPRSYFVPTDGRPAVLTGSRNQQWTHNLAWSLGIQYNFTF